MKTRKPWTRPYLDSEACFDSSALACGKVPGVTTGSRHFAYDYDTFTGHLGPGFGGNSSSTGNGGIGFGPSGASQSYGYTGICTNWISIAS